ncbi:ECF transporter S component [Ligilactobacillus acidipiscis]|jgi:riboflavin transporter FmnP|uniref:Riboflavin transporter n=1 Tax=Ligilactobacillus acidipiscis TaxID=89059 RepID=A0A0R2JXB1_9LACO|nr:ECF transporter S component [Ligilactobacillus acidipiscis]KRN81833.1 membrane protein-like protein [Ligilactobacillus acidipiscis]MCI1924420.1 ECF transporter S component [Ligilactobacillus acidipiscis]SFV39683.1 Substrate-specific component RibU of riboflavin ECF transporter [Ligilactobacillus acidipiscis]
MKKKPAHKVVLIAILGAMAYLLMLLDFPLPFMPPFLSFDLAQIPEVIGTLILGPISGITIALLKELLKISLTGSGTMFTGELINFIVSVSFILPTWWVYRQNKTTNNAVYGMMLGTVVATLIACLANVYFILPLYAQAFNLKISQIVAMSRSVNPYINSLPRLVLLGIAPFNLLRNGLTTIVLGLSLKRLKSGLGRKIQG